jgi:hypothetical protein
MAGFFPVLLRVLISIFHPKEGELTKFVYWAFGEESRNWVMEFISAPSYEILTSGIWSNAFSFFSLWLIWICLASLLIYKLNWSKYA